MAIYLSVEAIAGSHIETVCAECIALADKLGIGVDTKFNGVTLIARAGDDPKALAKAWDEEMKSDKVHKIATVRGRLST